jgi:hypothetical protein
VQLHVKHSNTDLGICALCKSGTIVEGETEGQRVFECSALGERAVRLIRWPVRRCTEFEEKGSQDLYQLHQMAWILETRKGKPIGFISPLQRHERDVD